MKDWRFKFTWKFGRKETAKEKRVESFKDFLIWFFKQIKVIKDKKDGMD